jgi:hypothetical protein
MAPFSPQRLPWTANQVTASNARYTRQGPDSSIASQGAPVTPANFVADWNGRINVAINHLSLDPERKAK